MSGNPFYFTGAAQTVTGNCANVCSGIQVKSKSPTFSMTLGATTSPSATVLIYGTVDGVGWTLLATLTSSVSGGSDSATPQFPVGYTGYYANVQAISGVSAAVTVSVGF